MLNDRFATKIASDIVGHSSTTITNDLYMHSADDTARAAINCARREAGTVNLVGALIGAHTPRGYSFEMLKTPSHLRRADMRRADSVGLTGFEPATT